MKKNIDDILCIICNQVVSVEEGLLKHLDQHKFDDFFECPDCASIFKDLHSFKGHVMVINNQHFSDLCSAVSIQNVELVQESLENTETTFNIPEHGHMSVVSVQQSCRIENNDLPRTGSTSSIAKKDYIISLFTCSICNKSFDKKSILKTHQKLHSAKHDYQCNICGRQFVYAGNLNVHMSRHTDKRSYVCKICGKTFRSSSNLSEHVNIHSNPRIECEECGKLFANQWSLKKHKKLHTGEKPYECKFCNRTFRQMAHLTNHLRVHSGEKPFKCEYCDGVFVRKDVLAVHQRRYHTENKTV